MQIQQQREPEAPAHPLMKPVFPRFTPVEAVILNLIASNSPNPVMLDAIVRKLRSSIVPNPAWGGPTKDSVRTAIGSIRAKLGERRNHPSRLLSVYELTPRGTRGLLAGYAWKG